MALSFAVNLGPLSEIEFGYKDVATAVYLANDLRGWWKARERAISLEQTLGSSGTSLVPSFTFNSNLYLELRRDYSKAWGVARTVTNTITRLCLPRASTATEGSPGLLCLRALTTALLCFVDQEQTPYILKDILPSRLFHYDQADKEILIEGPYFAALVQYVQSIATEEGADEIRAHLLRHTDSQLPRVTSATLAELQNIQNTEVGHLAGFLDWLLTAIPKRQTNCYRTRSLKVWCLALVLSDLGFEVEADRTPMIQRKEPSQTTPNDDDYNKGPMVVLVLAPGWHTDTGRKLSDTRHDIVNRPINVPPRLVPIRALPSLVFTDYAHNIIPKKTVLVARDLEEAFFGTYIFVRHHLSCDQKICDAARFSGPLPIDSSKYKILLESSCDTTDIKSFYKRVEVKEEYGVLPDLVKPYMVPAIRAYLVPFRGKIDRRSMNFMVTHIRVACVLAIISLFVMGDGPSNDDTGLDLQLLYTGSMWENTGSVSLLDECYTKSNFFVNYLRSSRDSSVRETLANPIQDPSAPRLANPPPGPASRPDSWSSLVLKVMLNIDRLPSGAGRVALLRHYWGAQRQGLVLLSDFILRPSTHASSAYLYHSLRGHLLDIPTKEGRVIEGLSKTPRTPMTDDPLSCETAVLSALQKPPPTYIDSLRIDLEPCWESDGSTCQFVLRAAGVPRLQLGISSLFASVKMSTGSNTITRVHCADSHACPGPESIFRILLGHKETHPWNYISLSSMIEEGWLGFDRQPRPALTDRQKRQQKIQNFLVNTYNSDILLMLALHAPYNSSSEGRHRIVSNCLGAALLARVTNSSPATMIILSDERHNRFLDATLTGYDKREDCLKAAASIIYNARRDRLLGSSLESSMALPQVTNLVMRVPEDDYHIKTIVSIFQDHIENKGITQAGVLKVLRAVDIAIDPNPWCNTEIRGFERLTNTLIAQWQKENMSDSELAEMLENMNCVDEEIDRTEELAALGLGRVISSGQEDIPVADEGQDASSSSEDPIQDRPSLVMGEEGNSQHWTTATLESSDESDVSEFQATPFESA